MQRCSLHGAVHEGIEPEFTKGAQMRAKMCEASRKRRCVFAEVLSCGTPVYVQLLKMRFEYKTLSFVAKFASTDSRFCANLYLQMCF